jgi:translation initiation factor 2B subunit (eIF-2B alpha/beta/delta family)
MDDQLKTVIEDNLSGSTTLTIKALAIFRQIIKNAKPNDHSVEAAYHELQQATKMLVKAQPNMALMRKTASGLVLVFKRLLKGERNNREILQILMDKTDELEQEIKQNIETIALSTSRIITNFNKIMTISNSTIIRLALERAADQKKKIEVYCLKSHPPDEGILLAEKLAGKGIKTTILADAEAASFLPEMNLVLVGADRLYEDGFINKVGTLSLCLSARHFHIPVYLTVETGKILKESERAVKLRSYPANEIYERRKNNLKVENIYFERVPLDFVSKIMCEEGVFETHEFIS